MVGKVTEQMRIRAQCDDWQAVAAAAAKSLPLRASRCLHARARQAATHVVAKSAMRQRA